MSNETEELKEKLKNIPILRTLIPALIAQEILEVQPMTAPTSLFFQMRAQFKRYNIEIIMDCMNSSN